MSKAHWSQIGLLILLVGILIALPMLCLDAARAEEQPGTWVLLGGTVAALVIWAVLWTLVGWMLGSGLPAHAAVVEIYAWAVVLTIACCSTAHWGLLLVLKWGQWRAIGPATAIGLLLLFWLVVLLALFIALSVNIALCVRYGWRSSGIVSSIFCALAVIALIVVDVFLFLGALNPD